MIRQAASILALLLVSACSGSTKVVRLDIGQGASIVHSTRADVEPVELADGVFKETLAKNARRVPLFSFPLVQIRQMFEKPSTDAPYSNVRRHLSLLSTGSAPNVHAHLVPELAPAAEELTRAYQQWCGSTWGHRDCLCLLAEHQELDSDGKYTLAMAIAQRYVLGQMMEALGEMVDPMAVYASITSAMAMYLLLWALPEPVSKGLAATLTVALIAYLGVDTVWRLIDGWLVLMKEVDRATTFEQIEASGTKYGKTMGRTAAKAFVMLVTVALGSSAAGMASTLPSLPGAGQAAVVAETQLGIRYGAVAQVESVTVSSEGANVVLAPNAVAMTVWDRGGEGAVGSPSVPRAWGTHGGLRKAMGPAGEGKEWHHIVEQTSGNVERFGPEALHNTENVIPLDKALHTRVSAFYSSIRERITGSDTLTVRQWLSTQSYEAQREFGLKAIEMLRTGVWN